MEQRTVKRCGFVIRVSTDKQARNPEGSLTNQLQRLQAHLDYKNNCCQENWVEAGQYILKGVSGKDSFRSPEFAQLFHDMESGRVNTVICTALDRISRSVKDFLNFFEILTKYNVEFVCLKQNYDTTSSQGKLFITIMMALAEFERTQTSERNKDATIARAERGLWNGGHLLGFDLDPAKKGYLFVNEQEKAAIQFAFTKYLECGSMMETARQLNANGFRTKSYMSRRNKPRPPEKFGRSTMRQMLVNLAYVGKKEINKKWRTQDQDKLPDNQKYRTVPAVWEPLVDEETFHKVQHLLAQNNATRHNGTTTIKHVYILNGGLLICEACGKPMHGTCGTGHLGGKYFYYHCRDCRFKMPADEVERVIIEEIKHLATSDEAVEVMVRAANDELHKELPQLKAQREALQRRLSDVKAQADSIMVKWAAMATTDNNIFLREKLDDLAQLRKDAENGINKLDIQIDEIQRDAIRKDEVTEALSKFTKLFETLKPYLRKEIIRYVLKKAILGPRAIKIALLGKHPNTGLFDDFESDGKLRCQTSIWLPGRDTQRTINRLTLHMPIHLIFNGSRALDIVEGPAPYGISTYERVTKTILRRFKPVICKPNPVVLALKYQKIYDHPDYQSMEKVAQEFGVSRVRIHQMLNLLKLDQRIIDYIIDITNPRQNNFWTERRLRQIAQLPIEKQYEKFQATLLNKNS